MTKHAEPWKLDRKTSGIFDSDGREVATSNYFGASRRIKDCVNALAGLEPGDVATLVELVRRYHAACCQGEFPADACAICRDARPLIERLPKGASDAA